MNPLESVLQRKQEVIREFYSKACSCKIVKYFLMNVRLCKDCVQSFVWEK